MSEEKKTVELKDDELDKVVGGFDEGTEKEIEDLRKQADKFKAIADDPNTPEQLRFSYLVKYSQNLQLIEKLKNS